MLQILIVYESKYGQTKKIAHRIAEEINRLGHYADVCENHKLSPVIYFSDYDGIIIGAPVYRSGFSRHLKQWVKQNSHLFRKKPSAFFSVCLGILQKDVKVKEEEKKIVRNFFQETFWIPETWRIFAGGLPYSHYNWIVKFIMKKIADKAGFKTQTDRDYEYTDWDDVKKFVQNFIQITEKMKDKNIITDDLPISER
jgi:menaquinone-dependent protoporphyrinogen oxidase